MARIKYSYGLLNTHAKCTNKGLLGNGVSRGLRFGVAQVRQAQRGWGCQTGHDCSGVRVRSASGSATVVVVLVIV